MNLRVAPLPFFPAVNFRDEIPVKRGRCRAYLGSEFLPVEKLVTWKQAGERGKCVWGRRATTGRVKKQWAWFEERGVGKMGRKGGGYGGGRPRWCLARVLEVRGCVLPPGRLNC
ncbi:MAG: hypothetical protein ACTSUE_02220 [Promethearchaeota archaeon]